MADLRPRRLRKMSITTVIALVLTTAVSTAVIAAHSFTDVPDDNTFHLDIEWLDANRVTRGCNPPANTQYCPDEDVTREQMAAFMRRLTETFGTVGDQVIDPTDEIAVDSAALEELLVIGVRPQAEAHVALNAHATIELDATGDALFEVLIARESCDGPVVGSGLWAAADQAEGTNATVSITGFDTIDDDTDYVLCAAKDTDGVDGLAHLRGLTATWSPDARR
jgi:hypothetical protein